MDEPLEPEIRYFCDCCGEVIDVDDTTAYLAPRSTPEGWERAAGSAWPGVEDLDPDAPRARWVVLHERCDEWVDTRDVARIPLRTSVVSLSSASAAPRRQ